MPITKSAKKALRQSKQRRVLNIRRSRDLKKTLKDFEKAVLAKNKEEAHKLFPHIQKILDKSAKRGLIKTNTASRKKSRLSKQFRLLR